jgi:hypothetical protein
MRQNDGPCPCPVVVPRPFHNPSQLTAFGQPACNQGFVAVEHGGAPSEPSLRSPSGSDTAPLPRFNDRRCQVELGGECFWRQSQAPASGYEFVRGHGGKLGLNFSRRQATIQP